MFGHSQVSSIPSDTSLESVSSIGSEEGNIDFGSKEAFDKTESKVDSGALEGQADQTESLQNKDAGVEKTISYVFERVTKEDSADVIPEFLNRYYIISQRCFRICMLIFLLLIGFIGTTTEKAQQFVWNLFDTSLVGFVRLMTFVLGTLMIAWFVGFYIDDHRKKLLYFKSLTCMDDMENIDLDDQKINMNSKQR